MLRTAVISVALLGAFIASPAAAEWGAVAVNKNTGHFGWSWGTNDRSKAVSTAMGYCRSFSKGMDGCELRVRTQQCFAVAYVGKNVFAVEATSTNSASAKAMSQCKSKFGSACTLHGAHCSDE